MKDVRLTRQQILRNEFIQSIGELQRAFDKSVELLKGWAYENERESFRLSKELMEERPRGR